MVDLTMTSEYSQGQMVALALIFMILPMVFYGLRIWARILLNRVGLDDYLAGGALLLSIICCSLQLSASFLGHLGQHQPVHPDGTMISNDPGLAFFEKSKFALNLLSIIGLGLVKSSILVVYLNLFPSRRFRWCVFAVLGYVVCWTISFFFSHLFTCMPITAFVDFFQDKECIDQVPMYLTVLYTNVIADFAILVLPIPMVLRVQLKWRTKVAVIGMLSLGGAVCAVSVTRVLAIYAVAQEYVHHPNDIIYYTAPVFFWTNIELSMAVVCSCLLTLRPIWVLLFGKEDPTANRSYEGGTLTYGSSGISGRRRGGGGGKGSKARGGMRSMETYTELDEMELGGSGPGSLTEGREPSPPSAPQGSGIVKQTTIHQTVETCDDLDTSSVANLRRKGGVPGL